MIAASGFLLALFAPFTSSDFEVHFSEQVSEDVAGFLEPCTLITDKLVETFTLLDAVQDELDTACEMVVQDEWEEHQGAVLDRVLGPVVVNGQAQSWNSCLLGEDAESDVAQLERCTRHWIIEMAGLPVGEQYLTGIIRDLFRSGELFLGILIFLFSIVFPFSKVGLSLVCSLSEAHRKKLLHWLEWTSKWSMTDVFVVALVIVFFKANTFNFHFRAEVGAYAFALAAILSSQAVHLLSKVDRVT
jgi:hypothetical protein